jgi:hypothetical protein
MRSIIQQQHAGVIQLLVGTSRFHQHMWDLVHVLVFFPSSSSTQVASFKNTYDYFSWKFKWAHKGNMLTQDEILMCSWGYEANQLPVVDLWHTIQDR